MSRRGQPGGCGHETEVWQNARRTDWPTDQESLARHGRMMAVIAGRIEAIRVRLGGRGVR